MIAEEEDTVRIRHAMAAGTAVSLLSLATSLMASATASAEVVTMAAPTPAVMHSTTAAGSPAGLVLGLLAVIGVAGVSFVVRLRAARSTSTRRVITMPEVAISRDLLGAYAE